MERNLFQRLFRDAAPRQARQDDPDLQRPGLVDDETPRAESGYDDDAPARRPIGAGLADDSVAMPGGGQSSIEDLEDRGLMSDDLMRKARPEVWQRGEQHARDVERYPGVRLAPQGLDDPESQPTTPSYQSRARVYDPRTGGYASHRGPAVDAYAHYVGDTDDMPEARTRSRRERLYAHAVDEAGRKGVLMSDELPIVDPRQDPIRRIQPGTSPEDVERQRYNRLHTDR